MASLDIDGTELVLRLTAMEKLGALHGDIRTDCPGTTTSCCP
jgi:hypothetical protein